MATTRAFHQAPLLMPVVRGDSSYSSGVHPARLSQEKVATRKVRTYTGIKRTSTILEV